MRAKIALFVFLLASHWQSAAYACSPEIIAWQTLVCPIDQAHIASVHPHAGPLALGPWGWSMCSSGALYYPIYSCPSCHFTGVRKDFEQPVSPALKAYVVSQFKFKTGNAWDNLTQADIALQIYAWQKRSEFDMGQIALAASNQYLPPGVFGSSSAYYPYPLKEKVPDRTQYFRVMAADYLESAWQKNQIPEDLRVVVAFQIGEMNRRLGHFDKAIKWFDTAKLGQPLYHDFARDLANVRERAQEKDSIGML